MDVTLLGEQLLAGPDGVVRARSSRTIALIAFLVAHGDAPQTRQRIAAAFWPDSSDEQALTNLRRELHQLRAVLGDEPALVVTPRDLAWRDSPTCVVDVRAFRADRAAALAATDRDAFLARASAAVARYGGEFLPGSDEDWARDTRAELEQQCVDLLDRCVAAHRGAGDPDRAIGAARRRVALRPVEESGYRTLIELHGEQGDRAGAVSAYHHCASVLERELGVEPDPLTRAALNRLLARSGPAVAAVVEPPRRRTGGGGRFVGRAAELQALRGRWGTATTGVAGLVLLRGDPGIGKSRLMAELADEVRHGGAVVAQAQCFGTSGRLALAPVADWLRTPAVRAALPSVDPVWRAEVERLLPPAGPRAEPARPGPRAMVDAWQRHRFFEGLSRAVFAVDRPVLLTIDNLQWCDQETLAFTTFCLGLATDEPVLVVATLREDHDPAVGEWIARMRATGRLTEIALGPFEVADTAALAAAVTGSALTAAEADLLHATTGGFPLYIVEAGRADAAAPAGDQLASVLQSRLAQVSDEARDLAGLAAAVGRDVTLDLLTEAADLPADAVVRAVDELWRSRILREVGDGYDFSHDLLRDVAYAGVSPPRRWLLHRRVAQGLELLHADEPDAVSAQLAEQYARGGRPDRAVDNYRRAAAVAASMFAHDEAIRLHEAALEIVRGLPDGRDRLGRELTLIESLVRPLTARYGPASPLIRDALERAIGLAETLGRRESALDALVGLWAAQFVHGDTAVAHRTATRALEIVPPDSPLRGPVHFGFAGSAASLGRLAESVEHFALAARYGGAHELTVGTRTDVHGPAWTAHVHWLLGDADRARECAADAVARARAGDSAHQLAVALAYAAVTRQLRGDRDELGRAVAELGELCGRYSFAYYREWGLVLTGWSRDDGTGAALARRGVEALTADGALARMPYWLSLCADIERREGRPDAARAMLDAALESGRARDDVWWLPEVLRARAALGDDADGAVARLREGARLAAAHGSVVLLARCRADLAARGVPDGPFGVPPEPADLLPDANGTRTPRS
ncbi:ATP-binding protein [Pseudonocardia broussonetiae]|uniref:AAA family ATPase n=1 Tax=Pseudonocardia broussonetiae TaxID=2736640 RepID=A0A6M6JMC1_9PSEU|nr:AAA family ATPase [Pseudonocardia broussonetiae]QJY47441.1 AAA family ATPase [Pseudonocardia broussonetiae]